MLNSSIKSPNISVFKPTPPSYTVSDYVNNCRNPFGRFPHNSSVVGGVLLKFIKGGSPQAIQFPPLSHNTTAPQMTVLGAGLYAHTLPNGSLALREDRTEMGSRRSYHFHIKKNDEDLTSYTYYPCSPVSYHDTLNINMPIKRFLDTPAAKSILAKIRKEEKSGGDLRILREGITERERLSRKPSQNSTMGHSAVKEFSKAYDNYSSILTKSMKKGLLESTRAPLHAGCLSEKRPEWLHGESFKHSSLGVNPQRRSNLGAARKCHNTEMMILEGVAKWFATQVNGAEVYSNFVFKMLLDTEVIDFIYFTVTIQFCDVQIQLNQAIDAFAENPPLAKISDMAVLINILCQLIQKAQPTSVRTIEILPSIIEPPSIDRPLNNFFSRKRKRLGADYATGVPLLEDEPQEEKRVKLV